MSVFVQPPSSLAAESQQCRRSVERRRLRRRAFMNGLLLLLIGVFIARLPAALAQLGIGGQRTSDFLSPIAEVYQRLMREHVDAPDSAKLQRGAIDGMLKALEDDYAEYIPEEDAADFEKEMTGHFVGIGCQIEMRDGWLTVVSPLEDSPALEAGIIANDRISKIEGKTTFGLTSDDCIKMLTGQPNTQVSFTVERDGKEIPFTLNRRAITNHAVRGLRRDLSDPSGWTYQVDPEQRIAYIRISQFTPKAAEETADALEAAMRQAGAKGIGGLILDLRYNPGGVMDGALAIADMFLDGGVIMSIRGREPAEGAPAESTEFEAQKRGTLPNFPMVVLVNENSASASEIVSGSLRDHDRAIVLGTRTFGKGLVQSVSQLRTNPKAQIKFTTQRYYLPGGRCIQRENDSTEWGVDPSPGFYVPITDAERVEGLTKRREWDVLSRDSEAAKKAAADQHWSDPAWIESAAKDRQLAAAVKSLQARLASGEWKPVSDVDQQNGKLAVSELHALEKARDRLSLEFARIDKRITVLEKAAENGSASAKIDDKTDLWPDVIDLTGGTISVKDKDGKQVAKLDITGRDIERWLLNADVKAEAPAQPPEVKP